jgi:hypothetical protein
MAFTPPAKVYRLQGISSNVRSSDEVVKLLRKGRESLEHYDVHVHSLATGLTRHPSKVAGIMFSLRPRDDKLEETPSQASGEELTQHFDGSPPGGAKKRKKKKRKGEASSQGPRADGSKDPAGLAQPAAWAESSALTRADPFIEMVSRVKDGLVLDDNFFGMTPLVDIVLDDHEFE